MNIAICDDCARDIKSLEERILKVVDPETIKKFYEFHSGKDLLDHYTKFDIIFLDIRMEGGISGRQAAKMIHSQDPDALISFYTAYDYPSSRIVNVHPFSYIMKDLAEDKIKEMLRLIFKEAHKRKKNTNVIVYYNARTYKVDTSDILYIAILDKGSAIYLTEKGAEKIRTSADASGVRLVDNSLKSSIRLDEYYKQLKDKGFIYAKKSYIVNAQHITARLKDSVKMKEGAELTVARSKKKEFDDQLNEYWMKCRGRGQ
ncbi:MAG: response regulator transcription factor [Lachnospiraceae bacterium]|nr:response regulator transcription factor [Lachnospiraceae bacterium]